MTFGLASSTNANAGIDADIIEIAGFPLEVSPDSKPQSDSKFSVNYNLSLTQNLNNPRGDAINYFLAVATTYQSRFTQFDQRSFVFGLNSRLDVEEEFRSTKKSISNSKFYENSSLFTRRPLLESNAFSVSHSGSLSNGSVFEYGFNVDKRNFIGLDAKSGYRYGTFINNTFNLPNNNSSWTMNIFSDKYEANQNLSLLGNGVLVLIIECLSQMHGLWLLIMIGLLKTILLLTVLLEQEKILTNRQI